MSKLTLTLAFLLLAAPGYSFAQGTVQWGDRAIVTANTDREGDAGTVYWIYQNNEQTSQFVDKIQFQTIGTNLAATACRAFFNNGQSNTKPENNVLFDEITLPATTASEVAEVAAQTLDVNVYLPKGARIFVTVGTAPNAAGWRATVITKTPNEVQDD